MSFFEGSYYSCALQKQTVFQMILPNDALGYATNANPHYQRPTKTIYLLHGYSENYKAWMTGSMIQELCVKYNLAAVMPWGDNSFYLDQKGTGKKYGTFVGEELVEYITRTFGLSKKKEDTFIGGLSMGGFGALHTGLLYPETFGKIMAFSSALIIHEIKHQKPGFSTPIADYDYYASTFGDLDLLEDSDNNPETLVRKAMKNNIQLPDIYMAVGTEDFLRENNRAFHEFLVSEGVNVSYHESKGIHNWEFWSSNLEPALKWMLEE